MQPHDWAKFLRTRLDTVGEGAPLDGIARGGYKLVYTDTPTDFYRDSETRRRTTDLTYSLGITIGRDSKLTDVLWEGPAFKAGLTVGTELVAVNGTTYSADRIKDTIKAVKTTSEPIELIVKNGERFRTVRIDYHDGLRYPRLERNMAVPARLDDILAARELNASGEALRCIAEPLVNASCLGGRSALGQSERHEAIALLVGDQHQHALASGLARVFDGARNIGRHLHVVLSDALDDVAGRDAFARRLAVGIDGADQDAVDAVVELVLLAQRRVDRHQAQPERALLRRPGPGRPTPCARHRASRSSP